jgi:hypothetical protein
MSGVYVDLIDTFVNRVEIPLYFDINPTAVLTRGGNRPNTSMLLSANVSFDVGGGSLYGIADHSVSKSLLQIPSFEWGWDGELYVLHFGGTIHQIDGAP